VSFIYTSRIARRGEGGGGQLDVDYRKGMHELASFIHAAREGRGGEGKEKGDPSTIVGFQEAE